MRDAAPLPNDTDDVQFGPLIDSLGFLLRLSQLASYRDYFQTLGDLEIRPGEISVLILIGLNPGIRQGVLARQLMIKRAHMTKMVRSMEETGLVSRTVPADDKRSMELRLTDKGAEHVSVLSAPFRAFEARSGHQLSRTETSRLKQLLRKYLDLPEPAEGGAR